MTYNIDLSPEVANALQARAHQQGIAPELLIVDILQRQLVKSEALPEPRNDWERRLLAIGTDCGVSLSNEELSREAMYD